MIESSAHMRGIGLGELKGLGLTIIDTRSDATLDRVVRELYVSLLVTFEGTGAYKIFENSEGAALIKVVQVQAVPFPFVQQAQPQPPAS